MRNSIHKVATVLLGSILVLSLISGFAVAQERTAGLDDDSAGDDDSDLPARQQAAVDNGWVDEGSLQDASDGIEHEGNPAQDIITSCTIAGIAGATFGGPAGAITACSLSTAETLGGPWNYQDTS